MRTAPILLASLLALGLAGCANTPEMRTLARTMGTYADAHRAGIVDAKGRYEALNADAERERAQLDEQTAEARRRVNERVRAGRIARPPQVVLAEATAPEDIVGGLRVVTTTIPPVDAGNAAAKLEAATKITAQLSVKPKRLAQLQEAIGVYGEIQGQLETLDAKAAEDAAKTKTKAAKTADANDAKATAGN